MFEGGCFDPTYLFYTIFLGILAIYVDFIEVFNDLPSDSYLDVKNIHPTMENMLNNLVNFFQNRRWFTKNLSN